MARQRNLHPDFFSDADLLDCDPLARLLYAGMWGLADRRGVLEDKPLELKIKLLPADNCDIHSLLAQLIERGRVVRYEADGVRCLWIPNLPKHQKFHPKELPNKLPNPPGMPPQPGKGTAEPPCNDPQPRKGTAEGGSEGGSAARNIKPSEYQAFGSKDSLVADAPRSALDLFPTEPPAPDPVEVVLAHYTEAMDANGIEARSTPKRRKLVERRLKEGFTPEQLKQAIDGLTWSDWHMGKDPKSEGKSWTDLKYAIGDAERVEDNIRRAQSPPSPPQRAGGWR